LKELPIYKIGGKYYFRDERLQEYRNIDNPNDRKPIDSVLEKPTKEDSKKVFSRKGWQRNTYGVKNVREGEDD
jgi:hypothetical protein